jgi:hypothetical protein
MAGKKPSRQTPADQRLKRNNPSAGKPPFGGKKAPPFKSGK